MKGLNYMKNRDIAMEWFKMADLDFNSAKFLLNMRPMPFEIICYHCQQCAEKYLKGYMALKGLQPLKIHDLTILNKQCITVDLRFKQIEDECIELTDYGVQIRYPFHIELEEKDVQNAIKNAQKIADFVKNIAKEEL